MVEGGWSSRGSRRVLEDHQVCACEGLILLREEKYSVMIVRLLVQVIMVLASDQYRPKPNRE